MGCQELIKPTLELKAGFLAMAEEYRMVSGQATEVLESHLRCVSANCRPGDENRHNDVDDDFAAYIQRLEDGSKDLSLPEGHVPSTTYWLVRDGKTVLGCGRLRHRLTPALENEGGHIGYDIRLSERRKGYGVLILKLMLEKAFEMGINPVLVTSDTDNIASARIIEKNGGKLKDQVISKRSGKRVSRYWIHFGG